MMLRWVKSGLLEKIPHQPLGQQVLDEHLIHLMFGEAGVQRRTAELHEISEGLREPWILFVRFGDVLMKRLCEVGNAAFELIHGTMELALIGFVVGEEPIEEIREFDRFAKGVLACLGAVLVKNRRARILENRVAGWIAGLQLLLYFGREPIGGILGLPPSTRQAELVAHSPIGHDALAA
jgi:hypothetical protein